MTQRDAVDEVIDRFGADLEQAERRADRARRPRSVRRLLLAGGGLAVAGSAAVLAIGTIGGATKLDVVSEAQAALETEGQILHMKIVFGRLGKPDDPSSKLVQETWSATNPNRWKFLQVTPYVRWTKGKAHQTGEFQTEEFAFAGGTLEDYNQRANTMTMMSGYPESGPESAPFSLPGMPTGQDPIASLRSMLSSGRLSSAGTTALAGRKVLRLRGTSDARMERGIPALPVEYDVDAHTFAPVRIVITNPAGSTPGAATATTVIWFRAFERLPITDANEALLTIKPEADTKITHYNQTPSGEPCKTLNENGECGG